MAITAYDNTAELPDWTQPDAGQKRGSRIIGVCLVRLGFDVETLTTDPTTWDAGIAAKDLVIINPVTGNWPESSETVEPGIGRTEEEYVNDGYDVPWMHRGAGPNLGFYNNLKNAKDYGAMFVFEDDVAWIPLDRDKSVVPINFLAKLMGDDQSQGHRKMMVRSKWKSEDFPYEIGVPRSLFPQ